MESAATQKVVGGAARVRQEYANQEFMRAASPTFDQHVLTVGGMNATVSNSAQTANYYNAASVTGSLSG